MRSTDRGETWSLMPVGATEQTPQGENVVALAVDAQRADHLWAGLEAGGVMESRDSGRSWLAAGLEGKSIRWLNLLRAVKRQQPDNSTQGWRRRGSIGGTA